MWSADAEWRRIAPGIAAPRLRVSAERAGVRNSHSASLTMPKREDLLIAPFGEAFLLFLAAVAGWLAHQPLIFASLGPTAYELVETPHRRTAKPYSVVMGHLIAIGSGYLALWLTHAWYVAPVSSAGVPFDRIWACVLAAALTAFGTLLLKASQPAAIATALLISAGVLQRPIDAGIILAAVLLMLVFGEPIRLLRLKRQKKGGEQQQECD